MDRNFAIGQTCQDVFVRCTLGSIGTLAMSTTNAGATTATKSNTPADIHTQKSPQQQLPTHYFRIDELNASLFSQKFVACWTLGGLLGTRCVDTKKTIKIVFVFDRYPTVLAYVSIKRNVFALLFIQQVLAFVSSNKKVSLLYR